MQKKRLSLVLFLSPLFSVILTVVGLLYAEPIYLLDYTATPYGFPCSWLIHVTATFAGRTDFWRFEPVNLLIDIVLFYLIGFGLWLVTLYIESPIRHERSP